MTDDLVEPHSIDTERALLACALLRPEAAGVVVERCVSADFWRHAHRLVFDTLKDLSDRRIGVDFVAVKESLHQRGKLDEVGGAAYLAELLDVGAVSGHALHYADQLRDLSLKRAVLAATRATLEALRSGEGDGPSVVADAEQRLLTLQTGYLGAGPVPFSADVGVVVDTIEERVANKHQLLGRSTGFKDLDEQTCGLVDGDLTVLAGDPGGGKTALANQIGLLTARRGECVVTFSLEMPRVQLHLRMLSVATGIPLFKIRKGWLVGSETAALGAAVAAHAQIPLHIDDDGRVSASEIRGRTRRLNAQIRVRLIIVDYVQLVRSDGRRNSSRAEDVGATARALKQLARELNAPVLALSQLNRDAKKEKRPPDLSDLRESGELEQHADNVWMIYAQPDEERHRQLLIRKARNGPTTSIPLTFDKPCTRFVESEAE